MSLKHKPTFRNQQNNIWPGSGNKKAVRVPQKEP